MRPTKTILFTVIELSLFAAGPQDLIAQTWNDPRSRSLVEQATERRARQIADTALASYKAGAHGYLTFLAQVG